MKTNYRRKLPHINPLGATFFVTFRLIDSVPTSEISRLSQKYDEDQLAIVSKYIDEEKRIKLGRLRTEYFLQLEALLHAIKDRSRILAKSEIMSIVREQILRFDGDLYNLLCFSIMSNHVHLVFETSTSSADDLSDKLGIGHSHTLVSYVMQRIKGATARYINKEMGTTGAVWEKESYDIYIRNEKMLQRVISYVLNNPVKAGIVSDWKHYAGNYIKPGLEF